MPASQFEPMSGSHRSLWSLSSRKNKKAKQEEPRPLANSPLPPSISSVPSQNQRDLMSSPTSQHSRDSRSKLRRKSPSGAPVNGRQTPVAEEASHSNSGDDDDRGKGIAATEARLSSPTPDENRLSIFARISRTLFRPSHRKPSRGSQALPAPSPGRCKDADVRGSPEREFRIWPSHRRSRRNTASSARAPSAGKDEEEETEMDVLKDASIESSHPMTNQVSTSIDEQIIKEVDNEGQNSQPEGQNLTHLSSSVKANPRNEVDSSTDSLPPNLNPAIVIPTSELSSIPRFRTPPYGTLRVTNEDVNSSPSAAADSQELLQRLQSQFHVNEENRRGSGHQTAMTSSRSTVSLRPLRHHESANPQDGADDRQISQIDLLGDSGCLVVPSSSPEQHQHEQSESNNNNDAAAAVSMNDGENKTFVKGDAEQIKREHQNTNDDAPSASDSPKPLNDPPISTELDVASIAVAPFSPLYRSRTGSSRYSPQRSSSSSSSRFQDENGNNKRSLLYSSESNTNSLSKFPLPYRELKSLERAAVVGGEPFVSTMDQRYEADLNRNDDVKEAVSEKNRKDTSHAFEPLTLESSYQDQSLDSPPTVDLPLETPTLFEGIGSQSASLRLLDRVNSGSPFAEVGSEEKPHDGTEHAYERPVIPNIKTTSSISTSPFPSSDSSEAITRGNVLSFSSVPGSVQSPRVENGDTPTSIDDILEHSKSKPVNSANIQEGNVNGYDVLTSRRSILSERLRKSSNEVPALRDEKYKNDPSIEQPNRSFSPPLNFSRPNPVSSCQTSMWENGSATASSHETFPGGAMEANDDNGQSYSSTPSPEASLQDFRRSSASQLRTRSSSTPTVALPPKITPETVEVRSKIMSRPSPATRALQESIFYAGSSRSRYPDTDCVSYDGPVDSLMSSCSSSSIDSDEATERGTNGRIPPGLAEMPSMSTSPREAVSENDSGFVMAMSVDDRMHKGVGEQQQPVKKSDRFTRIGSLDTAVAASSNSSTSTSTPTTINERLRSYLPFAFRGTGNPSRSDGTENNRYNSDSSDRNRYLPTEDATMSTTAGGDVGIAAPKKPRGKAETRQTSSSRFSATPPDPASTSPSWLSSSAPYHHRDHSRSQSQNYGQKAHRYGYPNVDGSVVSDPHQGYKGGGLTPGASSVSNYTATSTETSTQFPVSRPSLTAQPSQLIAKVFVICHQCERFHDLPPAEYAALIMAEVANVEGGKGGGSGGRGEGAGKNDETHLSPTTLTVPGSTPVATPDSSTISEPGQRASRSRSATAVEAPICCWCSHRMTKDCCAGWTALVSLQQRTLTH